VYRTGRENEVQVSIFVAQIVKSAQQELTVVLGKVRSSDTGLGAFEWPKFWQD
jgi:hypothetical protein